MDCWTLTDELFLPSFHVHEANTLPNKILHFYANIGVGEVGRGRSRAQGQHPLTRTSVCTTSPEPPKPGCNQNGIYSRDTANSRASATSVMFAFQVFFGPGMVGGQWSVPSEILRQRKDGGSIWIHVLLNQHQMVFDIRRFKTCATKNER